MKKTVYEKNFERLEQILGGNLKEVLENAHYLKLKAEGFMDLSVDILGKNKISIAHNFEMFGDIVPDPDMELEIDFDTKTVEALTYQNQFIYSEVYTYDENGNKKGVYTKRKKELNDFLSLWTKNLIEQKHKITEKE